MDNESLRNGILSFIIPGLGQYLYKDINKAVTYFGIAVLLHLFIWFFMNNPFGSLVNTAYHAYAGYDAYMNTLK